MAGPAVAGALGRSRDVVRQENHGALTQHDVVLAAIADILKSGDAPPAHHCAAPS